MAEKPNTPGTPDRAGGVGNADPPTELPTQGIFQIGDTTIIATAHYQNEGKNCTERLVNLLKNEVEKQ